jgi:hypothetical protein
MFMIITKPHQIEFRWDALDAPLEVSGPVRDEDMEFELGDAARD